MHIKYEEPPHAAERLRGAHDYGIYLEYSDNCEITNNKCANNRVDSVHLKSSNDCIVADNGGTTENQEEDSLLPGFGVVLLSTALLIVTFTSGRNGKTRP